MMLGSALNINELFVSHVLIADKNETEVARLASYIDEAFPGCHVTSTKNLPDTLLALQNNSFDFIIIDLSSQQGSELETLQRVVAQAPDIPILVYSEKEDMELSLKALKLGAQDYLIKGRGNAQTLYRIMRYSTERKRIEQQLSYNEQLLRTFILHVPAGIVVLDDKFRIMMTSHRWREDHGLNDDMVEGRRLDEVLLHAKKGWFQQYTQCMGGEHIRCPEEEFITNEGQRAFLRWEMMPWFDAWGRIGGVIEFTEFITEQRQLRKQLEDANQYLEERVTMRTQELMSAVIAAENAQASKDEFFANITHEFRTPLHAIINFSRFGMKKYESAERETLREYFEDIHTSGKRLHALVDDVLDLTKQKAGKSSMDIAPCDLRNAFAAAKKELSALFAERGVSCDQELAVACGRVMVDARRLHQVLTNLLSNAAKFSDSGGRITLRTAPAHTIDRVRDIDGMIVICVSDTGIGIPEEDTESIFDPFIQSQRIRSGEFVEGTGLGLAICRQIVQAHGGMIWAENNPCGGAAVYFTLPAVTATEE